MPQTSLQKIETELLSMADDDVAVPHLPVAVVVQEAHELWLLLQRDDGAVGDRLMATGLEAAAFDRLKLLTDATREAQSRWHISRMQDSRAAQKQRLKDAVKLRRSLHAACRHNLRAEPVAQATLGAIAAGRNLADHIQALHDLAALIDKHRASFAADATFNAAAQAAAARETAETLSATVSTARNSTSREHAKRLRDRSFGLLAELLSQIRAAGRYSCRDEPALAAQFASSYRRNHRRRPASE